MCVYIYDCLYIHAHDTNNDDVKWMQMNENDNEVRP